MTTASSSGHVGIVIEAVDRATRVVRNVSNSLRRQLGSSLRSAAFSMLSFTTIMSAMGVGVYQLVGRFQDLIHDIQVTNRAVALMGTQFRLAGFSADRAASAVGNLRDNLSRTALQAIPSLDEQTRAFLASLGPASLQELDTFAKKLSDITGAPQQEAFKALTEAAQGNLEPLEKLGIAAGDYATALEEIAKGHKEWEDEMTPLEAIWKTITDRMETNWNNFIDTVNQALGSDGTLAGRIEAIGNLFGAAFSFPDLGSRMRHDIEQAIAFLTDFFGGGEVEAGTGNVSDSPFAQMGKTFASQMLFGLATWLIGDQAVKIIMLGWQGNWSGVWKLLEKPAGSWGESIGRAIRDGLIKLILGDTFGQQVIDALDSEGGLMGKLKSLWPSAGNWGQKLGAAIGNGIISSIEASINGAVGKINEWIGRVETALNAIPGVSVDLPRVGGVALPRITISSPEREAGTGNLSGLSRRPNSGSANQQIVIPVSIGERKIETIVVDAMNKSVRRYQPGLGIS